MRTNSSLKYVIATALIFCVSFSACNKMLDVPPPPGEILIEDAFKDSTSALSAIAGIYNTMCSHGYFEWSGFSYNTSRSADDAYYGLPYDYFGLDSLIYTNDDVLNMWKQGFHTLFVINTCLKGIGSSTTLSPVLKSRLQGEILFCRAFTNFNLVNLWGNALPLIVTPDVSVNGLAKSVPQQIVYDQIITDLLQAKSLLSPAYPSQGRVRPNVMAVNSLLARAYLYLYRYNDAVQESSAVIESQLYLPLPAPNVAFLRNSKEAIWQLMPSSNGSTSGVVGDVSIYMNYFTGLTPQLLASFEPGDLRRQAWVVNNVFLGTTYITAAKYRDKGTPGSTVSSEYYIALRLAEQYLIRAEANVRLGLLAPAITDLNTIRARAGLPPLPFSLSQSECMKAVEQERRVELFTEWGHRWFDLKRWPGFADPSITRADELFSTAKSDWQPTDKFYPVPRTELRSNPFLVQNPGYPAE